MGFIRIIAILFLSSCTGAKPVTPLVGATLVAPRGKVTMFPEELEIAGDGTFLVSQLQELASSSIDEIQVCLERSSRDSGVIRGRAVVTLSVDMAGNVESAEFASSDFTEPTVSTCIVAELRSWRFSQPPTGGSVSFGFPLVFESLGE